MREPAVAGTFYPASASGLRAAIEEAFTSERGPGSLPPRRKERSVIAAIVPHAGYAYSGACAAWAYHAIAASPKPDLFIILGPNHHGLESAATMTTWHTPLGFVRADQHFLRALTRKGSISLNDEAHAPEHSIEVQLPFLQYLYEEELLIAPLLISHEADLQQLALDIKEVLVEQGKRAVLLASSDFTHHGPAYGHVRFTLNPLEQIKEFDGEMIKLILGQRPAAFLSFVERELATVCGARPITLLLHALPPAKGSLEQYYTSGEVTGDERNSVSYAAITFEPKKRQS